MVEDCPPRFLLVPPGTHKETMKELILMHLRDYNAGGFYFLDCYCSANRALAGILKDPVCRVMGPDAALDHRACCLALEGLQLACAREGRN